MDNKQVVNYIRYQLGYGASESAIKTVLKGQGWSESDINTAYGLALIEQYTELSGGASRKNSDTEMPIQTFEKKDAIPDNMTSASEEKTDSVYDILQSKDSASVSLSQMPFSGNSSKNKTAQHAVSIAIAFLVFIGGYSISYGDINTLFRKKTTEVQVKDTINTVYVNDIDSFEQSLSEGQEEGDIIESVSQFTESDSTTENTNPDIDPLVRISNITALGITAEKYYDAHNNSYAGLCNDPEFSSLPSDNSLVECKSLSSSYRISISLSKGNWYCIDSYGFNGESNKSPSANRCRK